MDRKFLLEDLRRRCLVLPNEIAIWKTFAETNQKNFGIHKSQLDSISLLLEKLISDQETSLNKAAGSIDSDEFFQLRETTERQLTGTHSIFAAFRFVLNQRISENSALYSTFLTAADLIASESYRLLLDELNAWLNRDPKRFREPPLVFLNSNQSPAALGREHAVSTIGLSMAGRLEERLPLPLISLPTHAAQCYWSLCAIFHEVGHLIDFDLNLSSIFKGYLEAELTAPSKEIWIGPWMREVTADAIAVCIGGPAFVEHLSSLLWREPNVVNSRELGAHPVPLARINFCISMLLHSGNEEWRTKGANIKNIWDLHYQSEAEVAQLVADGHDLGEKIWSTSFGSINTLKNLAERLKVSQDRKADWLQGKTGRPSIVNEYRALAIASQTAVSGSNATGEILEQINTRSFQYFKEMPKPRFLSVTMRNKNQGYLNECINQIQF